VGLGEQRRKVHVKPVNRWLEHIIFKFSFRHSRALKAGLRSAHHRKFLLDKTPLSFYWNRLG
jgi:hypothetical protein